MSAQISYGFSTPIGAPGGIVDLAPHAIDTFLNENETGKMKFGRGVVRGTTPGTNVALPTAGATAANFEGIVVNSHTAEYDLEGNIHIRSGASLGVMRYGRVYGVVADRVTPAYGEAVYMIADGAEAGCFTNVSDGNVAIKARFIGGVDATTQVAPIELFNQAHV